MIFISEINLLNNFYFTTRFSQLVKSRFLNIWGARRDIRTSPSVMLFICIYLFLFSHIYPQEYTTQTLKDYNIKFSFPKEWRWILFSPQNEEKKIFEAFNYGKKIVYQIYVESSKSSSSLKQFRKFLKKWNLPLENQPSLVGIQFPNLHNLNAYSVSYVLHIPRPLVGYIIAANDGILQYYFRVEVHKDEAENFQEVINKLFLSIDTIYEWKQICCSLCMKKIRYSKRTSTICTDYVTENPCYQYLKNNKMNYEKCR